MMEGCKLYLAPYKCSSVKKRIKNNKKKITGENIRDS